MAGQFQSASILQASLTRLTEYALRALSYHHRLARLAYLRHAAPFP